MLFKALVPLVGFSSLALAGVHDRLASLPSGWTHIATPDDSETIVLQVALKQQNIDKLHAQIYAVSTPGSPSRGQFLDRDEAQALVQPSKEANDAVVNWLQSSGASQVYSNGEYVNFAASVGNANKMLDTQFQHYENDGIQKLRTMQYSLPDDLADHVDFVTPTTFFGRTQAHAPITMPFDDAELVARAVDPSCATLLTLQCVRELYNVTYTPSADSGSKVAFGSFLNESARYADLSLYETLNNVPQQSFSVELINGGVNNQTRGTPDGEADLDVENIVGISHPLPVIEYITGGSPPFIPNLDEPVLNTNEPYLEYYNYLLSKPNSELPNVITNSYGDDEQTVPANYARRVCNLIGQLGLRGVSVLESSGDNGVGAPCQSNDGKQTPQFTPQFPATCPFITGVGGTVAVAPEIGWIGSGGGFSNYFHRTLYQELAVEFYLKTQLPQATQTYFAPFVNFKGRAFPDIAAHSVDPFYQVVVNNRTGRSGGTSAASPVVAGIIGLINDARFKAGKGPLGFLNPWLYTLALPGLTDVTGGGNGGCTGVSIQSGQPVPGASIIPGAGFNCTKGWDPVTGLGLPNTPKLIKLGLLLP